VGVNDFLSVLGDTPEEPQQPRGNAAINLMDALGKSPEEAAKAYNLQKKTLIPASLMVDPDVRKQAEEEAFVKTLNLRQALGTTQFLEDPQHAAMSTDLVGGLKTFEDRMAHLGERGTDVLVTGTRGILGVPQAAVGLLNLPTAGAVGKWLQDIGLSPREARKALFQSYSEAQKKAYAEYEGTEGFFDAAGAVWDNPSLWFNAIIESLPLIFAGGAIGKGALKVAPTALGRLGALLGVAPETAAAVAAGAIGEGAVTTGIMAEELRGDDDLSFREGAASILAGAGTAVTAGVMGRVSDALDVVDVERLAMGAVGGKTTSKVAETTVAGALKRFMSAALTEGTEEGIQEAQEQMWSNWAEGKPLLEGVPKNVVLGIATGGIMGAGGQAKVTFNDFKTKATEVVKERVLSSLESQEMSALRERSPDAFRSFVQGVGEHHNIGQLYFQADKIVEAAEAQGVNVEEWAAQYDITPEDIDTARRAGGVVAIDTGNVALGLAEDKVIQSLRNDILADPTGTTLANLAQETEADKGTFVHLNALFQESVDAKIDSTDIDQWVEDIMATPKIRGKATRESFVPLVARANALAELTGVKAIDHLNRMLKSSNLRVMKAKDFQKQAGEGALRQTSTQFLDESLKMVQEELVSQAKAIQEAKGDTRAELIKEFKKVADDNLMDDEVQQVAAQVFKETGYDHDFINLASAMQTVEPRAFSSSALTDIAKLRKAMGVPAEVFNKLLADAAAEGRVFLHTHAHPSSLSAAEKAEYLQLPGFDDVYMGIVPQKSWQAPLFQKSKRTKALGALSVSTDGENLVTLFSGANKSTFLHETGHIFLKDLKVVAEEFGVQKEQWQAVKEWLGIKGDNITTQQQERFARSFEAYLREGQAPSPELKGTFQVYKDWLTTIYESFKALSAAAGFDVEINPAIRDIFDNLMATKEEIAAAREEAVLVAMIDETLQNETGFTEAQLAEYREKLKAADRFAKEKRDTHKLKGRSKRLKAWRKQAAAEAAEIPVYAFAAQMKDVGGIDRNSVVQAIGKEATPRSHPSFKKGGMDANIAIATYGEKYGYDSVQGYFEDVAKTPSLSQWIQTRVARLDAAWNNQHSTEEAIRVAAARRALELESTWLAARARAAIGPDAKAAAEAIVKPQKQKAINAWARSVLRKMTASDIAKVTHFRKLAAQSRKSRKLAIAEVQKAKKASKTQDSDAATEAWVKALRANEQARLNEALIAESYKISNRYKKMQARWKSVSKWANQVRTSKIKVAESYRDQINKVMAAHSVSDKPFNPNTPDLNTFADQITNIDLDGVAPVFPDWIGVPIPGQRMVKGQSRPTNMASAKNLTWEQTQELNDAFEYLYNKGKDALDGMKTSDGMALSTWSDAIVQGLEGRESKEAYASDASWTGRLWQKVQRQYRSYLAQTSLLPFIAKRLDDYGDNGPAQQIVQRVRDGLAAENELAIEVQQKFDPILRVLAKKTFSDGSTVLTSLPRTAGMIEQGYNWDTQRVIAAAASMGNETSLQRLTDGNELDEASLAIIQKALTKEQWEAIQDLWDLNDFLWPKISATHQRLNYFTPKRVEAKPLTVTTADGHTLKLDGGYYPIFYDKKLVPKAAQFGEADDILASADNRFQRPTAKSGMTKKRAASVKWAMDLSFAPLATHFKDTIRYITLSEAVRDADRVFRDKDVARRGREVYGQEIMDMIRPALKDTIRPDRSWQNSWVEWARQKTSVFYMGWNFWTALQNTTGVFPAIRHVGWDNYRDGANFVRERGFRDSHAAMVELSPYMKLRDDNIQREMRQKLLNFEAESKYSVNIDGENYSFEDLESVGFAGIRLIDTLVAVPGWWGKYNAEMKAHGNAKKAVSAADDAINKALGSGLAIDTTQAMRSPITGLITPFMSFAATQEESMRTDWEAYKAGKIDMQEFAYRQLMTWIAPAVMSTFLKGVVMYGIMGAIGLRRDDKEQNQDTMDYVLDLASYRLMGMPLFRDFGNAFIYKYGAPGRKAAIRLPTMQFWDMIATTLGYGGDLAYTQDRRSSERFLWSLAELASFSSGVPVTQVYRRIRRGLDQIKKGQTGLGGVGNLFIPQVKKRKG